MNILIMRAYLTKISTACTVFHIITRTKKSKPKKPKKNKKKKVGSVVEWLKHRTDNQHGLGSKPTCAILLCPWERHFTALSPAWWS